MVRGGLLKGIGSLKTLLLEKLQDPALGPTEKEAVEAYLKHGQ